MDTLKLADELEKEQVFPAEQARAFSRIMVAAMEGDHASKGDLDAAAMRLDTKLDATAQRLDTKIDATAQRLDAKIDAAVLRLEVKIADSQKELVKWFAAIIIVQGLTVIGGTATLVRML